MLENVLIVNNTEFEKLLQKINREKEVNRDSRLNMKIRGDIFRSVASIYYFLTEFYGMPKGSLSVEDYNIAYQQLCSIALEKTKGRWHRFWKKLGINTEWNYFLEHGYFGSNTIPFEIRKSRWVWRDFGYIYNDNKKIDEIDRWLNYSNDDLPKNFKGIIEGLFLREKNK